METEKKTTKYQQTKDHLLKYGSISSLQAWSLYSYTRLSDAIWKLRRKEKWDIVNEDKSIVDRNGNHCQYVLYKLVTTDQSTFQKNIDAELANKPTGDKVEHRYTKKETTAAQFAEKIIKQAELFE